MKCFVLHVKDVHIIEGPNTHDQIAYNSFHLFLVEIHTNLASIRLHTCRACSIAMLRLGFWAPLVSHNYYLQKHFHTKIDLNTILAKNNMFINNIEN